MGRCRPTSPEVSSVIGVETPSSAHRHCFRHRNFILGTKNSKKRMALPRTSSILIMDAFTAISAIFAPSKVDDAVDTTSSYPVDEETGGSGGTAYCVIA
ncbi:hypothetical protein EDD15DRAFT_1191607 [Pisolithus albus]|nr:hypothetical protein EDD15DRAFT_1191607 [Pisolithus albus]